MRIKKVILYTSISLNLTVLLMGLWIVVKNGGLDYIKARTTHKEIESFANISKEYYENLQIEEGKIIMFGDSITDNAEWSELLNNDDVINRGISGDGTEQLLNRVKEVTDRKPLKIFILVGINDLKSNVGIEDSIKNYERIIEEIKKNSPDTQIYVESILPCNGSIFAFSPDESEILLYNEKLKEISKRFEVNYIELYDSFEVDNKLNPELTYDGLHLNAKGYSVLINILDEYIN